MNEKSTIKKYYEAVIGYPFYIKVLIVLGIIVFLFGIVSFFSILFTEGIYLTIGWSKKSWENLLDIYSFPIKCAATELALITITVTLYRIKQTKEQIRIIDENNRFSNYFKYYDEFKKYFLTSVKTIDFKNISGYSSDDQMFRPLYSLFYGSSYKTFELKIKEEILNTINDFKIALSNSILNKNETEFSDGIFPSDALTFYIQFYKLSELRILASRYASDRIKMKWPRLSESNKSHDELASNLFTIRFFHFFLDGLLNFESLRNFELTVVDKKYLSFDRWMQNEYQSLFPHQPKSRKRRTFSRRPPNL